MLRLRSACPLNCDECHRSEKHDDVMSCKEYKCKDGFTRNSDECGACPRYCLKCSEVRQGDGLTCTQCEKGTIRTRDGTCRSKFKLKPVFILFYFIIIGAFVDYIKVSRSVQDSEHINSCIPQPSHQTSGIHTSPPFFNRTTTPQTDYQNSLRRPRVPLLRSCCLELSEH